MRDLQNTSSKEDTCEGKQIVLSSFEEVMVVQIYVDDIVFGFTSQHLVEQFVRHMSTKFEMSLVKKLTYFQGLQARQTNSGIVISQEKYAKNLVWKFGLGTRKH